VAPEDMGKVIGRQGRIAKEIRMLIKSVAVRENKKVSVEIVNVPPGKYKLEIYRTGYRINDPYTSYISMGSPDQLSKKQVETLKRESSGEPVAEEIIRIDRKGYSRKIIDINENDVWLHRWKKLRSDSALQKSEYYYLIELINESSILFHPLEKRSNCIGVEDQLLRDVIYRNSILLP
jgi:hypothetical protein